MNIDPCRRAQEHEEMVRAVRDWFVETNEPIELSSVKPAILPKNTASESSNYGDEYAQV